MRRIMRQSTVGSLVLVGATIGCTATTDFTRDDVRTEEVRSGKQEVKTTKHPKQPNILLIQADDMGYSDLGCMGSEIATPNLDQLAGNGRILTNHHTGTVSAIQRAMLMSGTDHHLVGLGTMGPPGDERTGLPGYETYLNDRALSVADLLQDAGYHTYIAGKWHLGSATPTDGDPKAVGKSPDQWGFERSYTVLAGFAKNHFGYEPEGSKAWTEDGNYVRPPNGVHSATNITNKLLEYVDSNVGDGKPFFAYATYISPHWPLQVPEPWLSMYADKYDVGYHAIREARIARQRELGILPEGADAAPLTPETLVAPPGVSGTNYINPFNTVGAGYTAYHPGVIDKDWASLSDLEKKAQARYMEIYAGMVTHMDAEVGRLIQHLKDIGEYDNTFIIFHSDNGADGWPMDATKDPAVWDEKMAQEPAYSALGTETPPAGATQRGLQYGQRWAQVSNTPLSRSKGFQTEGGIRTPAIVKAPGQKKGFPFYDKFTHSVDEFATLLEVAGAHAPCEEAPENIDPVTGENLNEGMLLYEGRTVHPPVGHSFFKVTKSATRSSIQHEAFGTETYGRAAVYSADGKWKISWTEPAFGCTDGHWELFNIAKDPGEVHDLAEKKPEIVAELVEEWVAYLDRTGAVEPLQPKGYYP
jgi:arylsulfatase A-like enzyme